MVAMSFSSVVLDSNPFADRAVFFALAGPRSMSGPAIGVERPAPVHVPGRGAFLLFFGASADQSSNLQK
jgi:hypothetical protein